MSENVQKQLVTYCVTEGVTYGILTDGLKWIIYDVSLADKALADKIVVDFDICDQNDSVVMKSLWLWQGNFEGKLAPAIPTTPQFKSISRTNRNRSATSSQNVRVISLPELLEDPDKVEFPSSMVFADDSERRVGNYRQSSEAVLSWLLKQGDLSKLSLPLKVRGCFVNDVPMNASEKPFSFPINVDGFIFEGNRNRVSHVKFMCNLLSNFSRDPKEVKFHND